MDMPQMQTPPPTRDASSRRRIGAEIPTPSTVVQQRLSTPAAAGQQHGGDFYTPTPFQFSNLQFSPDVAPFPNSGPMSAPALPHSRLFWDQSNDGSGMDVDMPYASDPFGPTPHKIDTSVNWQSFNSPTPQMNMQAFHDLTGLPASTHSPAFAAFATSNINDSKPTNSRPNSFMSTTAGVDPTLIFSFSSPTKITPSESFNRLSSDSSAGHENRQPYEHQVRESHREKELARKAKGQHSRTNTSSSSGSNPAAARPGLQRSNTDSGFRKDKPSVVDSRSLGSSGAGYHIPRKSSPLKRQSQGSLTSIPEKIRARPRTRLVIDESGHARTETDPVQEEMDTREDHQPQYPGLWNEDEDTESASDHAVLSRNTSFNIPAPSRRAPKHARADSTLDRSDSFKMPRPNVMSFEKTPFGFSRSSSNLNQQMNTQKTSNNPFRRYSMSSFGGSFGETKTEEPQITPLDSAGDAQGALKQVVEDRLKRSERSAQGTLLAHNQRWAQASAELSKPGISPQLSYDPFTGNPNSYHSSPSTIADPDLNTPSTDRSTVSNEGIRCVCNSMEYDGQLMVQCESCIKWLHVRCLGLNHQNIPSTFLCIFCTGTTPVARGGRIREPIRSLAPQLDSPLGHKSAFRR
ncbi:hypothetical protein BU16DRAFT_114240 [Lophium mytilinum]|uniref:Zinc finger PHD-type domain-containing protein n=1 Tax=Lophium mytilinum TaxID=390894 RepID=A0A6A6QL57_9PEZI|nr:hypothetical protein BU16DRAFT_114240 [Lophium mytilinum]